MAKSTVIAIKAEISEFKKDLDALRSHAKETYSALNNETKKASQQWDKYNSVLKENSKNLKKLERDIQKLNAVKLKNGSLTKDETAQLKKLKAQLSAQKAINRDLASAELAKYNATKKNINAYKASLNAIRAQENYLKSEIATTQKSIASKNKSTAASKSHTASLKKEDAIRRSAATTIVRHIRIMESMAVTYYSVKNAWQNTFGAGVALNRQYESMSLGLSALLAAKTADITTTGKQISSYEKLQIAQSMTASTMDDIKKASFDTVATFDQMVGFYQQAIGHALAAGDAFGGSIEEISKNTIDLTKRMSNLGGSVGMSMDLINEEVRSLMSGDVSRDSKLALILFGSPTEANKAIKEAKKSTDGLTKLFDEVLEPFAQLESIMTFDKQIANLKGEFQSLQKEFSKPIFNDLKEQAAELTSYLKENSQEISDEVKEFYEDAKLLFEILSSESSRALQPINELFDALGNGLDNSNGNLVTSVALFSTFADLAYNSALMLENGFIRLGQATSYFTLDKDEWNHVVEETNKIIEENNAAVISYDHLGDSAVKAAKKIKDALGQREFEKSLTLGNFSKVSFGGVSDEAINSAYKAIDDQYNYIVKTHKLTNDEKLKLDKEYQQQVLELNKKVVFGGLKQKLQKPENLDKANNSVQKQIDLNNKLYRQYLDIIGTPYDKWALSVSDTIAELGKSTELTAEDFVKLGEALEQTNPLLAQQEQAAEKARELYSSIMATDYDKWLESTSDKMRTLAEDGIYTNEQLTAVWNTMQQDYEINLTINGLDDMQSKFDDMIDSQISLATGVNDWGNNLTGVAKNFANVAKSISAFKVNDLKFEKTAHKLKTKYAKDSLKIEKSKIPEEQKVLKQKELAANFDKDYAQAKNQQFSNELNAYSNLAGAIGSFYEAGSTAAKAAQAVQATLGIVNGYGAITQAWNSASFPANLPGVAAATAAVLPMIAQLSSLGGSGGSGGGASAEAEYQAQIKQNKADIELSYEPITNRLDQQISLLDAINHQGSSAALQTNSAALSFERDYALWKQDVFSGSLLSPQDAKLDKSDWNNIDAWENSLGFNVFDRVGDYYTSNAWDGYGGYDGSREPTLRYGNKIQLDTNSLVEDDRLLDALTNLINSKIYAGTLGQNAVGNDGDQLDQLAWLDKMVSELQGKINDWALSSIDTMNNLSDAADDFRDSYDELTNSTHYADIELRKSFDKVNELRGDNTLPDYLSGLVDSIQSTNDFLTDDRFNLLLSKDPADIEAQTALLTEFGEVTGNVFENGAKDALDYIDSIKAVSEVMAASRENIKSFEDSFKTDEQLTQDMAQKLGVTIATTNEGLMSLFENLKGGIDGLTDSELDFLNANKELIESNEELIESNEALIDEAFKTSYNNVQSFLDEFRTEQGKAQALAAQQGVKLADNMQELIDVFGQLVNDTDGLTDAELKLLDANKALIESGLTEYLNSITKNIKSFVDVAKLLETAIDKLNGATSGAGYSLEQFYRYMEAITDTADAEAYKDTINSAIKASAALYDTNNFETKRDQLFAQSVALRKFEALDIDTNTQIDYLREIEANTKEQIDGTNNILTELMMKLNESTYLTTSDEVTLAYQNVLGRLPDNSGAAYWSEQLDNGNITQDDLNSAIAHGAIAYTGDGSAVGVSQDDINQSKNNAIEYLTDNASTQEDILALVQGIYQKYNLDQYQTDDSGYNYWVNQIQSGTVSLADADVAIHQGAANYLAANNIDDNIETSFGTPTPIVEPTPTPTPTRDPRIALQSDVNNAYFNVLGRSPDASGLDYWVSQLESNAISSSDLYDSVAKGAIYYDSSNSTVSQNDINESKHNAIDYLTHYSSTQDTDDLLALVHGIYQRYGLDQYQTDDSGYNYWVSQIQSGKVRINQLDDTIHRGANEYLGTNVIAAFAEGGIVTAPTLSLIGEAGYNEAVIPLKDSSDPLQTKELVSAIKDLTAIVLQQAEDGRESRKLSEDQLLTLLDIEEKIA